MKKRGDVNEQDQTVTDHNLGYYDIHAYHSADHCEYRKG